MVALVIPKRVECIKIVTMTMETSMKNPRIEMLLTMEGTYLRRKLHAIAGILKLFFFRNFLVYWSNLFLT